MCHTKSTGKQPQHCETVCNGMQPDPCVEFAPVYRTFRQRQSSRRLPYLDESVVMNTYICSSHLCLSQYGVNNGDENFKVILQNTNSSKCNRYFHFIQACLLVYICVVCAREQGNHFDRKGLVQLVETIPSKRRTYISMYQNVGALWIYFTIQSIICIDQMKLTWYRGECIIHKALSECTHVVWIKSIKNTCDDRQPCYKSSNMYWMKLGIMTQRSWDVLNRVDLG